MAKGLGDIKRRISAVKNTQQITRAMKMVATAKLRRAKERMSRIRPYDDDILDILAAVLDKSAGDEHPLLLPRAATGAAGLVIVTADRGLCGSFNANILRNATQWIEDRRARGKTVKLFCIGRKGFLYFSRRDVEIVAEFSDVFDKIDYAEAQKIIRRAVTAFEKDEVGTVDLAYADFVSTITQAQRVQRLLPVQPETLPDLLRKKVEDEREKDAENADEFGTREEAGQGNADSSDFELEIGLKEMLHKLLEHHLATHLYRAMLESYAAELGARMASMDAATKNAEELIATLTLKYNRARQESITTELTEIVGGTAAMSE